VRYISTRGEAPALGFRDVVLTGLASDGGLYVPEKWPRLTDAEIASLAAGHIRPLRTPSSVDLPAGKSASRFIG
jgi:threonine synthase